MNATITKTTSKEYRAPRSTVVVSRKRNVTDTSYEAWKKANGLDRPLTRTEYVAVFNPCGL